MIEALSGLSVGLALGWWGGWWLWGRKHDHQWFAATSHPETPPPLPGSPQHPPRRIVGQRPAEGTQRPKVRQARWGGRSFRTRR